MFKNILVTGGAGYIGSHICNSLFNSGYKIFVIDNLSTGYKKLIKKQYNFLNADIGDFKTVSNYLAINKIDLVIHLAASLSVEESMKKKKKYFANNFLATKNLLRSMKINNVRHIIFSSTCSVYGNQNGFVNERTKTNPVNYYGKTKLMCENIIRKFKKFNKTQYAILRFFNVAGANYTSNLGQINKNGQLIKNLCVNYIKGNKKFYIFGKNYDTKDGTCVRDYIHVEDLANIHLKLINFFKKNKNSLILNCGYGKGYTVKNIVNTFERISKFKLDVIYKKRRVGDPESLVSDISLIRKKLNWKPKFNNIVKILASSLNWEKNF